MIARTASTGHVDANMLTIRNQYLQHYYEKAGDYRNAYKYLKRDYQLNDSIRSERIRTRGRTGYALPSGYDRIAQRNADSTAGW